MLINMFGEVFNPQQIVRIEKLGNGSKIFFSNGYTIISDYTPSATADLINLEIRANAK